MVHVRKGKGQDDLRDEQHRRDEVGASAVIGRETRQLIAVAREYHRGGEEEGLRDGDRCRQSGEVERDAARRLVSIDPGGADVNEDEQREQAGLEMQIARRRSRAKPAKPLSTSVTARPRIKP